MLKSKDLNGKNLKELRILTSELKKKIFDLNLMHVSKKLKDTGEIKKNKKDLARVLTVIKGKELGI
ncbi:MAG: 50S ribosomal protein L29 [Candidatus Woykebacteria bacterium RBG_13_40_7b]|uniref:Large ribosomal subunit protein uL29 n=1 Tax=Candidatus Woykebacteria bacterium RBG_13_40_7b TaxID=1802594 RepID=A0A1G1W7X7_9BACT|nr:MAG: 50S ribosomal protein L29 [Candidatus Woykebacteria bacterium RBG_13_40_7b]